MVITSATSEAADPTEIILEESGKILIDVPYAPWSMPWTNGELPLVGESMSIPASQNNIELSVENDGGVIIVSYNGDQSRVTIELEIANLADVPFKPGEITIVADGALIYVIKDELEHTRGTVAASREADVYDQSQPLIWYGTIRMWAYGVYDGTYVSIADYDSYVLTKPNFSNLTVKSTVLYGNVTSLAGLGSSFTVRRDNGAAWNNAMYMYISGFSINP